MWNCPSWPVRYNRSRFRPNITNRRQSKLANRRKIEIVIVATTQIYPEQREERWYTIAFAAELESMMLGNAKRKIHIRLMSRFRNRKPTKPTPIHTPIEEYSERKVVRSESYAVRGEGIHATCFSLRILCLVMYISLVTIYCIQSGLAKFYQPLSQPRFSSHVWRKSRFLELSIACGHLMFIGGAPRLA